MTTTPEQPHHTREQTHGECTCPCPDGQIVRIDKIRCRTHYERMLAEMTAEGGAHGRA
jgi:hypothetical protein